MIVKEVMTTKLVTVTPEDTLSHAANLLRQHQFHHLPVVRALSKSEIQGIQPEALRSLPVLEGLLTTQDIDLAAAAETGGSGDAAYRPWQERHVAEVMNRSIMRVTPTTSVAATIQTLVEQGLNCLPVVEYADLGKTDRYQGHETLSLLIGLITRSDLLIALARVLGAFEPGMDLVIPLPTDDLAPLANMLLLAAEMQIKVHSVIVASPKAGTPRVATVRIGTINPAPLLVRLQEANILYKFANFL